MNLNTPKPVLSEQEQLLKQQQREIESKVKTMLFQGVLWHKLKTGVTWYQMGKEMEEKGVYFSTRGFYNIENNWAANNFRFFTKLYMYLDLPTPTPELLLQWGEEIKVMQAARLKAIQEHKAKVQEGKAREAERIAAGGTPRKHNDRRK